MFSSNFGGFVSQDAALQDQSSSERLIKSWHGSEKQDSGDSGNCSEAEEEQSTNGATRSEFQLTQSLLSKVKAGENNKCANTGKQAQLDLKRMNFVINGKTIGKECVLRSYGKNNHLIPNGNEDYRTFAKQVFTEMFKHVEAEVPSDNILAELITNCNQAGYECAMYEQIQPILDQYNLTSQIPERTISIRCDSADSVSVEYSEVMHVLNFDNPEEKICESNNLLKFTLKSQDGKVEYKDGKVTFIIPEALENHPNGKNLLNGINEHFADVDNSVIESLVANIGEGPKSFVADPPAEVDLDSFNIIPEGEILNLDHIPELVKKAVDDKDVSALANHIGFFQDHVTHVSSKEGLPVVEKTLEIVSGFIKEQDKAWSCYPTVPIASHIYSVKQQYYDGYISQADYEKVENLKKTLCKIKSSLIKRSSNDLNERSSVTNAQDTSATLNETPILSQAVSREQLNTKESKNQQLQRNIVDKGENIMNNEKASIEAIGNNYRSGKMSRNKNNTEQKEQKLLNATYSLETMENYLKSNNIKDEPTLKSIIDKVNAEIQKKTKNIINLGFTKKKKCIDQRNTLLKTIDFLEKKIKSIRTDAKAAVSSATDVSATTSSQAAPVSEDVSQDIRSEILVPSSSVSPDVGNVSTAENINDNMVASKNSGQVNDVQSGDEQPDSPPLSPQSSASGDVEDTEASANAAVTVHVSQNNIHVQPSNSTPTATATRSSKILLQHTSKEQNTEMLRRFANNGTLENKDIEIVKLLISKGANPYFANPSAAKLATDKGNTQLTDLFNQSQLGEDSDNEFYDAEEDIVGIADEDKPEGNTRQATDEKSSNGIRRSENPESESAGSQQTAKNVLSSTKESNTINNVEASVEEPVSNDRKGSKMPTNTQGVESSLGQNEKVVEIEELQEQLASKDEEMNATNQALNAKTQALERTQAQLEKLQKDLDAKTKEFESAKAQLEREQDSVKQKLDKTTEELRRKEADLENSKKELGSVNEKVLKLKHETLNQQASINDLTKGRDQLASRTNTLTEELKNASEKLNDANQALNTKISEVAQLTEENSRLEGQLRTELNNVAEKLTQEQQKAFELGNQVTILTKERDGIKAQLEKNKRELDVTNNGISQPEQDLKQAKQDAGTLNNRIAQLTEENTKLKNELKLKKPENNDLKAKLQESESKSKGLESRVENLHKQLESKNKELNGKNEKFSGAIAHSKKQGNYASVSFVLSSAFAVGASLTIPYLPICISLAVAALTFLAVGCYCSYKANTALSNVEVDNCVNPAVVQV